MFAINVDSICTPEEKGVGQTDPEHWLIRLIHQTWIEHKYNVVKYGYNIVLYERMITGTRHDSRQDTILDTCISVFF